MAHTDHSLSGPSVSIAPQPPQGHMAAAMSEVNTPAGVASTMLNTIGVHQTLINNTEFPHKDTHATGMSDVNATSGKKGARAHLVPLCMR